MQTNLIEDILIYLPEWTNKPIPHENRDHNKTPCNHEVPAFIDEYAPQETYQNEYNYRKHISNEEIIHQYHLTKIQVASWLHRDNIPHTRDCYIATCMWTAGVLEEKYNYKRVSNLIKEAKEILEPYILVYFRVLDRPRHHHHHHHRCENSLILKVTEKSLPITTLSDEEIIIGGDD